MIDLNKARYIWLQTRNKDMMSECDWQLERLILMTNPESKDWIWTEKFEVTFNNKHEEIMLVKYLEDLGYKVETDYGDEKDASNLTINVRIGI